MKNIYQLLKINDDRQQSYPEQLFRSYGDCNIDFDKSIIQVIFPKLFYNTRVTVLIKLDLRNKNGYRISQVAPYLIIQRIQGYFDSEPQHQSLLLQEGSRLGYYETDFFFQQPFGDIPATFTLSYQGRPVYQTSLLANDNFLHTSRGVTSGSRITAQALAMFYGSRILYGGIGEYKVKVSESALLGVCQTDQKNQIYGQMVDPGSYLLKCCGYKLIIKSLSTDDKQDEQRKVVKQIDGLGNKDVILCVRLRNNQWCEFIQ